MDAVERKDADAEAAAAAGAGAEAAAAAAEAETEGEQEEKSSLQEGIERDVTPWLSLAEDLRLLSLDKELSVPQIAVMGDQSSGKSSVLEALSGIPFPRGTGLVTRCPIRLILRKARNADSAWTATAGVESQMQTNEDGSVDAGRATLHSPEELTHTIESITTALTRNATGFATEAIHVEVSSPSSPNLTVIDLPGIIRTATAGQDPAVIQQVNNLIGDYLRDTRTIILAVIPANQDIATVDILERAQHVDPTGERTIGVLTKPDLVGAGGEDEVMRVLQNVRKPLRLGYVMVKNRSQQELNEGVSLSEAREREQRYFRTHPMYRTVSSKSFCVDNLTTKLTDILVSRIQQELVPMKTEVERQLATCRSELKTLASYGTAANSSDRQKLLVTVMQTFVRHLNDCVRGEYRDRLVVRNPEVRLYTRALLLFEDFQSKINALAPPFKDPTFVNSLAAQIDNLRGRELPGFMSSQAFYMFMSQYVDQWRTPAETAVLEMRALTQEVAGRLAELLIMQYPALRETIRTVAAKVLEEQMDQVNAQLGALLLKEKDPFTINDFLQQWVNKIRHDRFVQAVENAFKNVRNDNFTAAKEQVYVYMKQWYRRTHGVNSMANAEDMSAILEAYWNLAAKRFVDNVCMLLDKGLMTPLPGLMQGRVYTFVQDEAKLEAFFEEDIQIVAKKKELEFRRERLTKANAAMANIQIRRTGGGQMQLRVNVVIGPSGLGLSLADEENRVVVRGFRLMPEGQRNPGQDAGIQLGDIIEAVNGESISSFAEAVQKLKRNKGKTIALTIQRQR